MYYAFFQDQSNLHSHLYLYLSYVFKRHLANAIIQTISGWFVIMVDRKRDEILHANNV